MFNLVPFTGTGWKMTNGYLNARFISEGLKLFFPEPQAITV